MSRSGANAAREAVFPRAGGKTARVEQQNYWLTTELTRQRYEGIRREAEHRHLLEEHGLDLWSVLRRAIGARLSRQQVAPAEPIAAANANEAAASTRMAA